MGNDVLTRSEFITDLYLHLHNMHVHMHRRDVRVNGCTNFDLELYNLNNYFV